jgi:hypothetical protein
VSCTVSSYSLAETSEQIVTCAVVVVICRVCTVVICSESYIFGVMSYKYLVHAITN